MEATVSEFQHKRSEFKEKPAVTAIVRARDMLCDLSGPRGWNDTRESWLARGARRAGLGDRDVTAFMAAVRPLAYDCREAQHDLARIAFLETYKRRTPCWIYFAQVGDGDLVKVGRSISVEARLRALSRRYGAEFRLLASVRGDYREEHALHLALRRHRVEVVEGREYFRLAAVKNVIEQLHAGTSAWNVKVARP